MRNNYLSIKKITKIMSRLEKRNEKDPSTYCYVNEAFCEKGREVPLTIAEQLLIAGAFWKFNALSALKYFGDLTQGHRLFYVDIDPNWGEPIVYIRWKHSGAICSCYCEE